MGPKARILNFTPLRKRNIYSRNVIKGMYPRIQIFFVKTDDYQFHIILFFYLVITLRNII